MPKTNAERQTDYRAKAADSKCHVCTKQPRAIGKNGQLLTVCSGCNDGAKDRVKRSRSLEGERP